jgi:hypothetical protein
MGGREAQDYWEDWGLVLLWTSMLSGPVAFAINLQVGYALVKWACSREQEFLLPLVAILALALTVWGAWLGWTCLVKVRDAANEQGGHIIDRSYFMAIVAIGLNALLALWVLTTMFPQAVLSPCE